MTDMTRTNSETPAVLFFHSPSASHQSVKAAVAGRAGATLVDLAGMDVPVSPGFILGTGHCQGVLGSRDGMPKATSQALREGLAQLESWQARKFGDAQQPLLLMVRSSPPIELPVHAQPVVNIGLRIEAVPGLAEACGNGRWAWDAYRRFALSF